MLPEPKGVSGANSSAAFVIRSASQRKALNQADGSAQQGNAFRNQRDAENRSGARLSVARTRCLCLSVHALASAWLAKPVTSAGC